jgi:branched-chain amino acid transport system substrate-binding protein
VKGRKLKLIVEDDKSDPQEASVAVSKLINQDGVVAVLGEVASTRSLAAAPICQNSQVPMISPSSTNTEVTKKGNYIFRICFIDPFQGSVMAKFARQTLKLDRVAILKDSSQDYSVGLADAFRKSFTQSGGTITAEVAYAAKDTDFRSQLSVIKNGQPQGIYVPGYYQEAGLIAKQARDLGITVPLMGGDGWDDPQLLKIAGAAAEGNYFSNHYSVDSTAPQSRKFVDAYVKRYGEKPNALAALGYDSLKILVAAMEKAKSLSGPDLRDAIAATKNFPAVTGTITLNAERNAVKPAVVLQIEKGQHKYVATVQP